jgi:hypothetical protein
MTVNDDLRQRIEELQQQIAERDELIERELEPPPRRISGGYASPADALRAAQLKAEDGRRFLFGSPSTTPADDTGKGPGDWGGGSSGNARVDTRPLDERADQWLRYEFDKQHGRNTR